MGSRGYRSRPLSVNRRMAAASAAVCRERDTIHTITEVDITVPRALIHQHRERTDERLSLTGYVVCCLGRTIAEHPGFNALRQGGRVHELDDVTIGTLIEREIDGELVPEPLGIRSADSKPYRAIHDEIRAAQREQVAELGALSGAAWVVRLVPSFLFRTFIRIASRSPRMAARYGVVSVTSVGMHGRGDALWLVPLSASTVAVAVGSIVRRPVPVEGGFEPHEHLCLTLAFDHDLIDGAPAARFTARFCEILAGGELLRPVVDGGSDG